MEKYWNSMMARVPSEASALRSPAKQGTAGMTMMTRKGWLDLWARRMRFVIAAPILLATGRWASLVAVMKNFWVSWDGISGGVRMGRLTWFSM